MRKGRKTVKVPESVSEEVWYAEASRKLSGWKVGGGEPPAELKLAARKLEFEGKRTRTAQDGMIDGGFKLDGEGCLERFLAGFCLLAAPGQFDGIIAGKSFGMTVAADGSIADD